ncbi:EAL domain-containing protein [uncultured Oceanisphaera sp.]|uniref:EAL domain-containing protein n=1 Tax=uncultured Oceanisphaera sp. TaxID=353858 RepID=UPI00261D0759|nr:EAL domain-containing protein [uncultured Oceanisphaera sp.]
MIHLDSSTPDLPVERLMHSGLLSCSPDTPVHEAAERMAHRRCSSVLIMDHGAAVGIWTEHDSLRLDFNDPDSLRTPIGDVMSSPVSSLHLNTPVSEVARRFHEEQRRHFLVVDDNDQPRGIVSQTDIALKQGLELYLSLREVHEAMDSQPLVLPGTMALGQTAPLMLAQRQDAAVVDCGGGEFGIITERDMVRFAARHPGDTPLSKLASRPLLTIAPEDSLLRARDMLLDHQLRHLAVQDKHNRQITGLLGFRHILEGAEQDYRLELKQALSQRDQALSRSRLNLQLAERVIEASLEGVVITDARGHIEFVNPAFTHTTGYSLEEVLGKTPAILSSGRHDASFYDSMWKTLQQKGYWRGEIWNRRKSGQLYLELLTITAIHDSDGNTSNYAALFSDITHIRENEDQIRKLAYYDALTKLPNRRLLEDRLDLAIRHAHRHQQRLAVVFIDLDHFKRVNDSLGHAAGDELLLDVSRRMNARLREDDTLARLGGDEFIVLLPDLSEPDEVIRIARRLLDAIAEPFRLKDQTFRIGCSLGVSLYPDDAADAEQLLHHADAAMYRAKQEGRNTFRLYSTHMDIREHRWLAMETALRNAIDNGEGLSLHYQPLVDRDSQRLCSLEALARWYHPEFGQVSPGDFIPLAERSGLILPLSRYLMQQVAARLRTWLDAGLTPVPVAVNLSAQQFWQQDLIEQIRALYDEYQLPAGLINFELTESMLLDKQQQAVRVLQQLRQLGCRVAMDDFGTGYSSLSYLHQLPITTLKVDRSFIQQLGENQGSETILAAITGMAQGLKLTVVAEGVETEEQLNTLRRYHVNLIQGYLTGRPMPAEQITERYLAVARESATNNVLS